MSDFEKLNIILAARDREFARAMERNTKRVERFSRRSTKNLSKTTRGLNVMAVAGKALAPVLAAMGAARVVGGLKNTVSQLDDIGKKADKIGLTTAALQEYRAIAESAGVSQAMLDSSLERLSKRLGEAALGGGAANKMLKEMGLEAGELTTLGLDGALQVIADKMALISDPTERAAKASALFGREGVAMVGLMKEGAAGMEKMRENARSLGIVIDEDLIRNAEGAQTQLDLMGRVIDAQLNSALVNLAPLLVTGATGLADMARGARSGVEWYQAMTGPVSEVGLATENLVTAMGDEIRQSQLLETALNNGTVLSVAAARAKLQEATSRHENVKAIIAEQQALVLSSGEWAENSAKIEASRKRLAGFSEFPGSDTRVRSILPEEFDTEGNRLAYLLGKQQELKAVNKDLDAQLKRTTDTMSKLQTGIGNAKGGIVNFAGGAVAPIENSPKNEIAGAGSAAGAAIPELTDYAEVLERVKSLFGEGRTLGQGYRETLAEIEALFNSGEINAEEYAAAVEAIGEKFEDTKAAAKSLEDAAEQTLFAIGSGAKSAKEAVADLLQTMAQMALKSAFTGAFTGKFDWLAGVFGGAGSGAASGAALAPARAGAAASPAMAVPDSFIGASGGVPVAPVLARSGEARPTAVAPRVASGAARALEINVNVSGARGNSEITEMVQSGVEQGLAQYDRQVLPVRVNEIGRAPRKIG